MLGMTLESVCFIWCGPYGKQNNMDQNCVLFQVLIEFDDIDWTRREWIRVHDIFQLFLVEHTLVWAERPDPDKPKQSISWPGLVSRIYG